jgi:5-methylthioadenosine/S-adenosylhomocysteine deaminase
VPAALALELATIGGARSLGLEDRVGTLERGKDADFAVFDLGAAAVPVGDPVAAAIFSLGGAAARFVAVAGKPLVRDGRLLRGEEDVAGRVAAAGRALRAWHDAATTH